MTDETTGRAEWVETDPAGVRHRVVIAPRGSSLRGGSASSDVASAVVEVVVEAVTTSAMKDKGFKVGVLRSGKAIERFVLKEKVESREVAIARAEELRERVRSGRSLAD